MGAGAAEDICISARPEVRRIEGESCIASEIS